MNNKIVELATLVVLLCLGALCMMDTPEPVISFQKDYLGNSGYPRIVGTLLIAASAIYAIYLLVSKKEHKGEGVSFAVVLPLLLAGLYIAGISSLGFCVSTVLFIFCFSLIGQGRLNRKLLTSALIVSVSVTAVTYGAFKIFKVYLPDALLF
jgi:hypothetical protein